MLEGLKDWVVTGQWRYGVVVLGVLFIGIGVGRMVDTLELVPGEERENLAVVQVDNRVVFEIEGAVVKPGVYELPEGSRWQAGLVLAGGLAKEADREWVRANLNLAREIGDGEKILIPKEGEAPSTKFQVTNKSQAPNSNNQTILGQGVVNINTASLVELETLPGIGPALAGRIIEYRQTRGGFRSVEELKLVSGIGDRLFEKVVGKVGI